MAMTAIMVIVACCIMAVATVGVMVDLVFFSNVVL